MIVCAETKQRQELADLTNRVTYFLSRPLSPCRSALQSRCRLPRSSQPVHRGALAHTARALSPTLIPFYRRVVKVPATRCISQAGRGAWLRVARLSGVVAGFGRGRVGELFVSNSEGTPSVPPSRPDAWAAAPYATRIPHELRMSNPKPLEWAPLTAMARRGGRL